jgi:hypothetical protein
LEAIHRLEANDDAIHRAEAALDRAQSIYYVRDGS